MYGNINSLTSFNLSNVPTDSDRGYISIRVASILHSEIVRKNTNKKDIALSFRPIVDVNASKKGGTRIVSTDRIYATIGAMLFKSNPSFKYISIKKDE